MCLIYYQDGVRGRGKEKIPPDHELHIQKAIDEPVKNKTVVVAHRLNTFSRADNIVVIDKDTITLSKDIMMAIMLCAALRAIAGSVLM